MALVFAESENRLCGRVCPKRDAVRRRMNASGYDLNPFKVPVSDVFLRRDLMNVTDARRVLSVVRAGR